MPLEICDYPFVKTDAGRGQSRRPRQSNDCTVRSVALAFGLDYDVAYDLLADAGRKCAKKFDFTTWADTAEVDGKRLSRRTFPAVKGERRMNPETFCATFKTGTYIVKTAKHVFVIKDGVAYDDHMELPWRCIYTAWEVR
jgi:hypothetical protein